MTIRIVWPLFLLACTLSARASAAPCDQLAALALKDATITSARLVAAGAFAPPTSAAGNAAAAKAFKTLPEFCRLSATMKPSRDSDIKIEVWLPASGWNGKFQAVGNGGWAGVSASAMSDGRFTVTNGRNGFSRSYTAR